MAKILIAGDAVVVKSDLKLEEIRTIEKYRPEALILKGGEDGKDPIFRLGSTTGTGSITDFGAEFGAESHDDEKKAMLTMCCTCGDDDIKEFVADCIGRSVMKLNKLEATLHNVLSEIEVEKGRILENISIAH